MTLSKKSCENIEDEGENASIQNLLLFRQCFLPIQRQTSYEPLENCLTKILCNCTSVQLCCLMKKNLYATQAF